MEETASSAVHGADGPFVLRVRINICRSIFKDLISVRSTDYSGL